LREGLYYPDGQIQDEVYVYGSFLQSAMYDKGVRCSNCHDPHSGSLRQAGNAICTQCHNETGRPEFPSLPRALFDSSKHHFHPANSTGAHCVSCHMPERVYMGIDARRDHGFRVPRPDLSEQLGAPDVCTSCHADRSADWAAAEIARRYPDGRHKRRHWGEVLAAARRGLDREAAQALLALAQDLESPAIVRASALGQLRPVVGPELAAAVAPLLSDPEPLVRSGAAELQTAAPPEERAKRLAPLLDDPQRSVRLAAIRGLLVPAATRAVPPPARDAWQSALRELQSSLYARADFPEVQLMIAGTAMQLASVSGAEAAFTEALRMDRQYEDAWIGLSRLKILVGRLDDARVSLTEGIAAVPQSVTLRFQLGQLELEAGDWATAVRVLELAHQLDPDYPNLAATLETARGMARDRDSPMRRRSR
jgi:predicted CXXCH cytochrome family protein